MRIVKRENEVVERLLNSLGYNRSEVIRHFELERLKGYVYPELETRALALLAEYERTGLPDASDPWEVEKLFRVSWINGEGDSVSIEENSSYGMNALVEALVKYDRRILSVETL